MTSSGMDRQDADGQRLVGVFGEPGETGDGDVADGGAEDGAWAQIDTLNASR